MSLTDVFKVLIAFAVIFILWYLCKLIVKAIDRPHNETIKECKTTASNDPPKVQSNRSAPSDDIINQCVQDYQCLLLDYYNRINSLFTDAHPALTYTIKLYSPALLYTFQDVNIAETNMSEKLHTEIDESSLDVFNIIISNASLDQTGQVISQERIHTVINSFITYLADYVNGTPADVLFCPVPNIKSTFRDDMLKNTVSAFMDEVTMRYDQTLHALGEDQNNSSGISLQIFKYTLELIPLMYEYFNKTKGLATKYSHY